MRIGLSPAGRRFTEEMHGLGAGEFRRVLTELSDADLGEVVRIAGLMRDAVARIAAEPRTATA